MTDKLTINGQEFRVVYNMRALVAFLKTLGTDTMPETIGLEEKLVMMMCCLTEGERKDGKEFDVDILLDIAPSEFARVSADFERIFTEQALPKGSEDGKKKE